MKRMNIAKRVLACGLAVAMVVTGGNYSTVNVSAAKKTKKAAKKTKATLSKKKVSMTAGGTVTLKVKKANKKVKWSAKNKKIVKITKTSGKKKDTAVIKGLKKGSTVVTAKVGKKKLKCKVTVSVSQLKSVAVDKLDYSALTVKLAKKKALNVGDIKVAVKAYKSGSYNGNPKVEALSTKDQKTYRVYLTSSVGLNDYVRVTVGKSSKEVQNKQKFYVKEGIKNLLLEKDVIAQYDLDGFFEQSVGYISYSLQKGSKLPKGLTLVGKRGLLKGIATEAGVTESTLIAKDEAGRKATLKLTFKVYDETTIAAADSSDNKIKLDDYMASMNASRLATAVPTAAPTAAPSVDPSESEAPSIKTAAPAPTATATVNPEVTPDPEKVYTSYDIQPKGGSGSYKYDLVQTGTDAGVTLSTDVTDANNQVTKKAAGSTKLYIPYGLAAGDHVYTINITDAADAARTTTATVTVKVVESFNISGTIKDTADTPLSGNEKIYFYPAEANSSSDYVAGRTFLKRSPKQSTGSFSYSYTELTAGNHPKGYTNGASYKDYKCANGDEYEVYTHTDTAQAGPFPQPTILTEAPTAAPSAAAPTAAPAASAGATPFTQPVIEAGNYAAEVPAGTYTVKVQGANGVRYQLDGSVSVAADALAAVNLTMPVRFANIKAVAKFANDKAVANSTVYFETTNKKYERMSFQARTDYQGVFTASLPAGTYEAYWLDEHKQKQYFSSQIKVQDGMNAELGDIKLAISRFEVSGTYSVHTTEWDSASGKDVEVDKLTGNRTLYFFDATGNVTKVRTRYDKTYDSTQHKTVSGPNDGKYSNVLLDNGTYTVRCDSSYDGLSTLGTVTINGGDVQQNFVYNEMSAGLTAEFANAAVLTLEQESVFTSTGNNDLLVKFAIPETQGQTEVAYDVTAMLNGGDMPSFISVYKEPAGDTTYYQYVDDFSTNGKINLSAGTYIMRLTPAGSYGQKLGNVSVKVSKHLAAYEKSSTALTIGTPTSIVCAKNVADKDFKYTAYVKISVEKGKKYEVNYASKTIGASQISVSPVSYQYIDDFEKVTKNSDSIDDAINGMGEGAGKITFTAYESGDVYLEFYTDAALYTTIDVSAVVK